MKKLILFFTLLALLCVVFVGIDHVTQGDLLIKYTQPPTEWETMNIEPLQIGSEYKYYFNTLTQKEKQAYNNILENAEDFPESIQVPNLTESELSNVFQAVLFDNPMMFYLGTKCTVVSEKNVSFFKFNSTLTKEKYEQQKAKINYVIDEITGGINSLWSDFEKEKYVHDYIINKCTYKTVEESPNAGNVYGALILGEASCEGYTKAFKLIMDTIDIESYMVIGDATNSQNQSESHTWNIVNIDGGYYHLDVTWDDPTNAGEYPRYSYFNLTDEEISINHTGYTFEKKCVETNYNYFRYTDKFFNEYNNSSMYQIAKKLKESISESEPVFQIRFSSRSEFDNAVKRLFDDDQIYTLLTLAGISMKSSSGNQVSYVADDKLFIIDFIIN